MRLTRSAVILAVVGVLLLVGAAVVRFAVLPSVSKLPTDLNTSQDYKGTYSGLNPAALAGAAGPALVNAVPMTASRTYKAVSTSGNTEVVDETIPSSIGGQAKPTSKTTYAVDRTTMVSAPAPSGSKNVSPSQGLVFTLPLHPSTSTTYQLWDATTGKAFPLKYSKTATVQGRTVYVYRSQANGTVASPGSLGLPTSITKTQLASLAPSLSAVIPAPLLTQLQALFARLPDTIPMSYTSQNTATVEADATTGAPLQSSKLQKVSARLDLGLPVTLPFSTVSLQTTPASAASLADDASSSSTSLNLIGVWAPIGLAVIGLVLLVWALVLGRRNAGTPGGATPVPGPERTTPAPV